MQRANAKGLASVGLHPPAVAAAERLGSRATVFEEAGFTALTPGWPDDPETVEEANAHPEVFAHKPSGRSPTITTRSSAD